MIVATNIVFTAYATHKQHWNDAHEPRAVDQLIEEMAELTQALLKARRYGIDREAIAREVADVCLALEFLGQHLEISNEEIRERVGKIASKLDLALSMNRPDRTDR